MDTKDCTILKTLAEENNITYAARRLFMTQPALSERIRSTPCAIRRRFAQFLYFGAPRAISYG